MARHAPKGREHTEAYPVCSLDCCGAEDHGACPDDHAHHAPKGWPKKDCPVCKADRKGE